MIACKCTTKAKGCKECRNAYFRLYYKEYRQNKTERQRRLQRLCQRRYQLKESPERRRARKSTTRAKALHLIRERNRRAIKLRAQGRISASDIESQFIRQNGRCAYCFTLLEKYHVDHVVPLSRNGSNKPENIVLACPFCNQSKGSKTVEEWRATEANCCQRS